MDPQPSSVGAKPPAYWAKRIAIWFLITPLAKILAGVVDEFFANFWRGWQRAMADVETPSFYYFNDIFRHFVGGFLFVILALALAPRPKPVALVFFCGFAFLASSLFYLEQRASNPKVVTHFLSVSAGVALAGVLCYLFLTRKRYEPEISNR